jgi:hypothetical protein
MLTGTWLVEEGRTRADDTCERIAWLIAHHLQRIVDSPQGAWETLLRAPDDGRYRERTYPQSGTHGRGPPQLKCLSTQEASKKYGTAVFALR